MGGNLLWLVHFLAGNVAEVGLPPTGQLVLHVAKANLSKLQCGYLTAQNISYVLLSLLPNGHVLTRYFKRA